MIAILVAEFYSLLPIFQDNTVISRLVTKVVAHRLKLVTVYNFSNFSTSCSVSAY